MGRANFDFFTLPALLLLTILLIFAMKYFVASRVAKQNNLDHDAYRQLAERAVAAQEQQTAVLATLQAKAAATEARLGEVEKLLKDVG
jgi:Tfp pilus assembly protein PilX